MRFLRSRASVFRVAKPGHGIDRDGRRMGEGFPRRQPAKRVGIWEACLKMGSSAASSLYGRAIQLHGRCRCARGDAAAGRRCFYIEGGGARPCVIFLQKVVDGPFKLPIMRTTPSDEALKELENQVLTEIRS